MSRMTSDVAEVEISIMKTLGVVVHNPINIIASIALLLSMNVKLTFIVLLLFPFAGFVIGIIGKSLKKNLSKLKLKLQEFYPL